MRKPMVRRVISKILESKGVERVINIIDAVLSSLP
jgi:hypothetical protein